MEKENELHAGNRQTAGKKHRKLWIALSAAAVLLVCGIIWFFPISAGNLIHDTDTLSITSNSAVFDGNTLHTVTNAFYDFGELSKEQQSQIMKVMEECSYHRILHTLFSKSTLTMEDVSEQITIYIERDNAIVDSVILVSKDRIAVNGKLYDFPGSDEVIKQINEILK